MKSMISHIKHALAFTLPIVSLAAFSASAQIVEGIEPNRGGELNLEAVDPQVAQSRLHTADGFVVELFASEKDFPLHNPVSMTFDAKGRLWVALMPTYPQRLPDEEPGDKIIILEDTNGDGKADKHTVFIDGIHLPTGFELGDGGVYIAQQPNLMFAKDTNGDDVADERHTILHGFGTEDSHHSISAFTWGPGGGLYFQEGTFHHSQVETPYGPVRLVDSGIFRFKPDTNRLEVFVTYRFANPWGHIFDRWGQNFVADASGGSNYYGTAFSGYKPYPDKSAPMREFTSKVRPTAGCEIISSRQFPDEMQGNFILNNTIGFQGIKQHKMIEEGSGFTSEELENLLWSSDINFRPVDLQFGPDGALYIVDWFNPLVGHMQYSLRDERRDHGHGRIWRLRYKDKPLLQPVPIAGEPISALLDNLKVYEDRTRYRTRVALREFPSDEVASALETWVAELDASDPAYEHNLLEALWVCENISVYNVELLEKVLTSKEPKARAAAVRVVRNWRHALDQPLPLLLRAIIDPHPRVRLEAVVALSYFQDVHAVEIALKALDREMDYYLDYALNETIDSLSGHWKPALADGTLKGLASLKASRFLVARVPTAELKRFPRSEAVFEALLRRPMLSLSYRQEGAEGLAALRGTDPIAEVLAAIADVEISDDEHAQHMLGDLGETLVQYPQEDLKKNEEALWTSVSEGKTSIVREYALAALVMSRGAVEPVWIEVLEKGLPLGNLVKAIALVPDEAVRQAAFPLLEPFLTEVPEDIAATLTDSPIQFVRIELFGDDRVLTVAEVEVFADGENVALGKSATQSSTAYDGVASRAVDGNTSAAFSNNGQTHTDGGPNPWLQIDLGAPHTVDEIIVWNRRDDAGDRLEGFTLRLLDANQNLVFMQQGIPAPDRKVSIPVESDPRKALRLSVIDTVVKLGVAPEKLFAPLASLADDPDFRKSALLALNALPVESYAVDRLPGVAENVTAYLGDVPDDELSGGAAQDILKLGGKLAKAMGNDAGAELQKRLDALGVTVIMIRPVPHQMIFDRTAFTVAAGSTVEVVFENNDIMPHNLVIAAQGALEKVGLAGEAMSGTPDGEKKNYVPDLPEVMHATKLLYPGQREKLTFEAPKETGKYPFVCTFPGHWLIMNGVMTVVDELTGAMREKNDTPMAEHAGHGEPVREFVKLWTIEDLRPEIDAVKSGRDFENGKAMFAAAGCNTCHVINGEGRPWGPDMSKALERYPDPGELLLHIIDPSAAIEEGYDSYAVDTNDFETITGFLVSQDDDKVVLKANQVDPEDLTTIPRDNIDTITPGKASIMPTGLLSTLQKDEIFDLVAYILAGGAPDNPAFKKE